MKRTFIMLKPDCIRDNLTEKILKDISDNGFNIVNRKEVIVNKDLILEHYKDVIIKLNNDTFTSNVLKTFVDKKVIAIIIEQDNELCVSNMRKLIGATEPCNADPNSIRGKYSKDSYEIANKNNRILENLIHASDSDDNANKEIKLWFNIDIN